ncbi:hypothetical protein RF55_12245 [Lasius niger]|uniref:Uncharacterized protein n=1 Tax=Lasius niger TaxID=67767 RepID=A0A0J7KDM2_LASNI|nr:hypothetical protein RF55_12245 [Lasius niger]
MRSGKYWLSEEERMCRVCLGGLETWEHVWEECGGWRKEGSWQEMVGKVLGDEGEGEGRESAGEVSEMDVGDRIGDTGVFNQRGTAVGQIEGENGEKSLGI